MGGDSSPRVFDGYGWESIGAEDTSKSDGPRPMKPVVEEGNGNIFVSIASFRDGNRCADTIDALFKNAKEPEKIFVGLVEQNKLEDKLCLELYCRKYGANVSRRTRKHDPTAEQMKCPHYQQIRLLSIFNFLAKGPAYARSLSRKIIGNEEYCLQIDAHSDFTMHWDSISKEEWKNADNEYAIISTKPPSISDKETYEQGGARASEVPRLCHLGYHPEKMPWFQTEVDATAQDLQKPLLARAWNAGFSFSKCHLEESAPYDNFIVQVFDLEEFPRFSRFWTRGYDVYTPTHNIVYHDYSHADGVDPRGYPMDNPHKKESVKRIKTLLRIPGGELSDTAHANLGIYGVGKRRSLSQLEAFTGIDMAQSTILNNKCGSLEWVPYDLSITPLQNLFDHADDLDPQPEFPIRVKSLPPVKDGDVAQLISDLHPQLENWDSVHQSTIKQLEDNRSTPRIFLLLWCCGLYMWYRTFVGGDSTSKRKKKGGGKDV